MNANWFVRSLTAAALLLPASAQPQLKYVVIVSRHGVRSPTWDADRLKQYSAEPWPDWGVGPGELTPHGRELIKILGSYYRERFAQERLLGGKGCAGEVYIWADTDERTLETGRAFAESLQPGCGLGIHSRDEKGKDPIFGGFGGLDPQLAAEAVRARLDPDPREILNEHRTALELLQFILDGGKPTAKRLFEPTTGVGVAIQGKNVELRGPFAAGSTLSENLLLEYTNGITGDAPGWGRLTKDNLFQVLELHRVYADLMRRTSYLARVRGSNLMAHVLASMEQAVAGKRVPGAIGTPETKVLLLSGHDTNLSNLSGILDLSWKLQGYQQDETPPGGALIFSVWSDGGKVSVRMEYLAASLDQMRRAEKLSLAHPPLVEALRFESSWPGFRAAVRKSIDASHVDFEMR